MNHSDGYDGIPGNHTPTTGPDGGNGGDGYTASSPTETHGNGGSGGNGSHAWANTNFTRAGRGAKAAIAVPSARLAAKEVVAGMLGDR